jgi:cation/acetate symporter
MHKATEAFGRAPTGWESHSARAVGGSILAGFISAVAFATILAVVSRLLTAGASSAASDLAVGLSGRQLDERIRLLISQLAAIALGVLRILLELACEGQNGKLQAIDVR